MKSIDKIIKHKRYLSGSQCVVDWIAGGNFAGYLYELSLCFVSNTKVVYEKTIIDSRYSDEDPKGYAVEGEYYTSDKAAFICEFGKTKMRCIIIGEKDEFIVASISYEGFPRNGENIVFKL